MLIAAGIMGGLAVAVMFLMKQQGALSTKSKIDSDLAQVKSEISSLLINPAHCNANFKSLSVPSSNIAKASILTCNMASGNARCSNVVAGTTTAKFVAVAETGGSPALDTNWPAGSLINPNLKISYIKVSVASPNLMPAPASQIGLTNATVEVGFSERILKPSGANVVAAAKRLNPLKVNVIVVANASQVLGCPRSWNTTALYAN